MNMFETYLFFLPAFAVTQVHRVLEKIVGSIEEDAIAYDIHENGADDDLHGFPDDMEPSDVVAYNPPCVREENQERKVLPGTKKRPLALING